MINSLEERIAQIEDRNKRVEADKAWETSWPRRILLFVLTYITILIFSLLTKLPDPFINSAIPAFAFVLSTMTLNWLKDHLSKN